MDCICTRTKPMYDFYCRLRTSGLGQGLITSSLGQSTFALLKEKDKSAESNSVLRWAFPSWTVSLFTGEKPHSNSSKLWASNCPKRI